MDWNLRKFLKTVLECSKVIKQCQRRWIATNRRMKKSEEKLQAKSDIKSSEIKSEQPGSLGPRDVSTGYKVPVFGCCVSHLTIVQKLKN